MCLIAPVSHIPKVMRGRNVPEALRDFLDARSVDMRVSAPRFDRKTPGPRRPLFTLA